MPVTLLAQDEGASFGAALQALWILQRKGDPSIGIADISGEHLAIRPDASKKPDAVNASHYEQGYAAYQRALAQLTPLFKA